jgi:hypothetical protein
VASFGLANVSRSLLLVLGLNIDGCRFREKFPLINTDHLEVRSPSSLTILIFFTTTDKLNCYDRQRVVGIIYNVLECI